MSPHVRTPFTRTLLSAALAGLLGAALPGAAKEIHRTVPLDADGSVSIKTFKGSISVTAEPRTDVEIVARVEPDGDDSDQLEKVAATRVRISGSGRSVELKSDYDDIKDRIFGLFSWNQGTLPFVHYTIRMPAGAHLAIDDYKSKVKLEGVRGELEVKTYKGEVKATGLEGRVQLWTYKGDVRIVFARLGGDVTLKTYKGYIEARLPHDAAFDLEAETGSHGNLESDFGLSVSRHGHAGLIRSSVGSGGPHVRFSTHKGTLALRKA